MKRDLTKFANTEFDLLIIGGGIHGAALLWQAAQMQLSVGLIEMGDFSQATSANSQKIIHGGLRYLQQFDIRRIRQSILSRKQLMMWAPHLVHPLKCIMPVYGHGFKGKEAMKLGMYLYDLIGFGRNKIFDQSKYIPNGKILSVQETNNKIPYLNQDKLKGGVQWYDGFCLNTERLVLAFIKSGCKLGGLATNYVKAVKIIKTGNKITGIKADDQLNGDTLDIRARKVVNCTGAWISEIYENTDLHCGLQTRFASGINIVVKKIFPFNNAVGISNKKDKGRLYFVVPWRGKSIVGTEYFPFNGNPDDYKSNLDQCMQLIHGFNEAYPMAKLELKDVTFVHQGLLPVSNKPFLEDEEPNISKKFKIVDHENDGIKGMFSVIGVKYTTAAYVTSKILRSLYPASFIKRVNLKHQLVGGNIDSFSLYKESLINKWGKILDKETMAPLVENYGDEVETVLNIGREQDRAKSNQNDKLSFVLRGQTLFAIREEMAMKLSDVILRRTDLGTSHCPKRVLLDEISFYMAEELEWSEHSRLNEINELNNFYPDYFEYKPIDKTLG